MIYLAPSLPLVAGLLLAGQAAQPLPDIARNLPSTWPPPGWATAVQMPGQPAQPITPATAAEQDKWVDVFPHVRINRALKTVEFDGAVAWDFHDPDSPRTELELLVCLPLRDKEHESLVLAQAKGAHVHAALLMVGLEPGAPGRIDFGDDKDPQVKRIAPVGPEVSVHFVYMKDGKEIVDDPRTWVDDAAENQEVARRKKRWETDHSDVNYLTLATNPYTFVFGGSKVGQMRNEQGDKVNVYNADELGTLIGLCTFGSETIGITRVYSADSGVDAPNFTANNAAIPAADTAVRVRIKPSPQRPVPQSEEADKAFPGLNDSLRDR